MTSGGEAELLRDALGDDAAALRPLDREPLGDGDVAGFVVTAAEGAEAHWYVDTSRLSVRQETGFARGEDPRHPEARIWLHPADPHLPALAAAAFPHSAALLLERLGLIDAGPPIGAIEMVGYRPGRRAVLRMATARGDVWVKVVRPSRVKRIVDAHEACREAGLPVPIVRGWSAEGLIVIDAARGEPLLSAGWEPEALLDRVDDLRSGLTRVRIASTTPGIASRLDWYTGHAEGDPEAMALAQRIGQMLPTADPAKETVVHGDLHAGQLFLSDGALTGMIDVDTLGRGAPAEDPAAFIAHAIASAVLSSGEHRTRMASLADAATRRWGRVDGVRAFTAIHLLGHLTAELDAGDARLLHAAASALLEGGTPFGADAKNLLIDACDAAYRQP